MNKTPIEIEGIDHLVLKVKSIDRSLEFYVGALGMHAERVVKAFRFCQVRCGRCLIDLMQFPEDSDPDTSGEQRVDHFCLNVCGDVDTIYNYLTERQIPMRGPPSEVYGAGGFGTSIYLIDPDNNSVELKFSYTQFPIQQSMEDILNSSTRPKQKAP